MKTFAVPSLFLLTLFALSYLSEADSQSGESAEMKKRRGSCGGLVQEPPKPTSSDPPTTMVPSPAPGECICTPASPTDGGSGEGDFHSRCILIEAFYNMSLSLTIEEQILWEAWIQEVENSVLAKSSLSDDEKIVKISLSLKAFFSLNVDISNKLRYKEIADWGFVVDFLYVSVSIQIEITQSIVSMENGCSVCEALVNATANGSQEEKDACQELSIELEEILEDDSFTYEQKMARVHKLFKAFFDKKPSMKNLILSIEIEGYGSMESFLAVCRVYEQITTLELAIGGSTDADCTLLAGLEEASKNSSFTVSQQFQILQLKQKLQAFFQVNASLTFRMKYVSAQCYQMFKLEPWMISIVEQISCGEWGSIYDVIFCSGICTTYGCGNPDDGSGPQGTTPSASSTSQGIKPADCDTIGSLIVVDANNQTQITNTLLAAYGTWTNSQRLGFNSCFNKVRKAIWDNVAFPNENAKLKELHTDFLQYNNNSVTNQQLVFNLTITIWQGTIGQFVACI